MRKRRREKIYALDFLASSVLTHQDMVGGHHWQACGGLEKLIFSPNSPTYLPLICQFSMNKLTVDHFVLL